jgi:hypothetical protein
MNKTKAAGIGVAAVIIGLAAIGLKNLFDRGGGFGIGLSGNTPPTTAATTKGEGAGTLTTLVITVDGEQYFIDGSPRSFDDVIAAATERAQKPSAQSESPILVKKKGTARYNTVEKLENELNRRGIRYRSEKDY